MPYSENQKVISLSAARFKVLISGRRFGKTFLAINEMGRAAAKEKQKIWYVAPSYRMAKQIAWEMFKARAMGFKLVRKVNESDLSVVMTSGSIVSLKGADNYDSLRGVGINFLIMDEFADIKQEAWTEVLRPTLSDTGGHALFCGTPKGRNWAYDLYLRGQGGDPDWKSWQFTTLQGGNVPAGEIEAARRDLDELAFAQEYEASFINFEGRAYYPFTIETHCAKLSHDPMQPLIFCFDFNVAPGVAAVCQEQKLPSGQVGTGVIGEVYIPRNSNTPAVCRRLISDWGYHQGKIICYGDATGGARGSAKVAGSDWDLIKQEFRQAPFASRVSYRVPAANPPERSRINAVNSRLKNHIGELRLMLDPARAPKVVKDFEGVQLLQGGAGEIDKKADLSLTHLSDAIGYYINYEFPTIKTTSFSQEILI